MPAAEINNARKFKYWNVRLKNQPWPNIGRSIEIKESAVAEYIGICIWDDLIKPMIQYRHKIL